MRRATTISLVGHGAVLLFALLSFSRPLENFPTESLAVDVMSTDEFSKMTTGAVDASKSEKPKPIVDKIGAPTPPVEDPNAQVAKKEVKAAVEERQPEPAPKPDPKPVEKKEPEKKVDPIAEALKKDDAKKPEQKAETKPQPVKKPEPKERTFDPRQAQALLDKRKPTRLASAGSELNSTASVGAPKGAAAELSQNELDALKARIRQCWTMPQHPDAKNVVVDVDMYLRRDGSLEAVPVVVTRSTSPIARLVAETATRAIQMCAPYSFLPVAKYENWKEIEVRFDASWATGI